MAAASDALDEAALASTEQSILDMYEAMANAVDDHEDCVALSREMNRALASGAEAVSRWMKAKSSVRSGEDLQARFASRNGDRLNHIRIQMTAAISRCANDESFQASLRSLSSLSAL